MKQVVQNLRSGLLELLEVPCPRVGRGQILIQSRATVISAGTERFIVEFGKANLLTKARQNPDRVKQVLAKIRADGLLPTLEVVFNKLDEPLPLGYCNAGTVIEVGADVTDYAVGDRVASNGNHAELVAVPTNLCAKIPDEVPDAEAAYGILATIGLQGVRLVKPELGETVVVFGLGLVGLLAAQMLVASGAKVIGIDLDPDRLGLAEKFGVVPINPGTGTDPVAAALAQTDGHGVDAVLIAASAKQDTIMHQAAQMSRKRGRIVLVGVVNLELDRADFYEKELSFQVSCSYGPGRYDRTYEQQGIDYPLPFVRWTEQRNLDAVLQMMSRGSIDVKSLMTHEIPFHDAVRAYDLLSSGQSQMGVVLTYPNAEPPQGQRVATVIDRDASPTSSEGRARVAMVGAGAFANAVLLPALKKTDAILDTVVSAGGVSAAHAARKFGFQSSSTDFESVLADDRINTVFITTRHDLHVSMVVDALKAGKHVFVEKPLALNRSGIDRVADAYRCTTNQQLMVGFNRRFAPQIQEIKQLIQSRTGPLCLTMFVNAGMIPSDHWVHDPAVGGGRIIGEGCHWIDLLRFLADAPIDKSQAIHVARQAKLSTRDDHCTISMGFADGSIGTLHYFANGHRSFPKEQLTVCCDGKVLELDNFRILSGFGWQKFRKHKLMRQDKGHAEEVRQFIERVEQGGDALIPFEELCNVTEVSIECSELAAPVGRPAETIVS